MPAGAAHATRRFRLTAAPLVGRSLIGATRSVAGIADSPLPVLAAGKPTLHLYSVPGALNDGGSNLGTFFYCTSTSTATQTVGVEVFPASGGAPINNAATSALTVAPGANPVDLQVARMHSIVADAVNPTPGSGWELTIVAKTKQKAAN
jgi:hypothetical protein